MRPRRGLRRLWGLNIQSTSESSQVKLYPQHVFFGWVGGRFFLHLKHKDFGRAQRAQYQIPLQMEGGWSPRPATTLDAAELSPDGHQSWSHSFFEVAVPGAIPFLKRLGSTTFSCAPSDLASTCDHACYRQGNCKAPQERGKTVKK